MLEKKSKTDVLLVEDNPAEARLVISAFKKCNPDKHITWINDGEKALNFIKDKHNMHEIGAGKEPMLVLLDLSLPKMSGIDILERIQEGKSADFLDVVVITGSQKESDRAKSYSYGVKTFMKKDIVCENCIKMICADKDEKGVVKAFNEAYGEGGAGK